MRFSILSVLSLLGCTGVNSATDCATCNDEPSGTTEQGCCGNDTTDPPATGSFTAPMIVLPDGTLQGSISNLVSEETDYEVPSGTTKDVAVDEYDITIGDLSLASEYSDGLPINIATDDSQWIAPSSLIKVDAGNAIAPEAQSVSRYVGGETWTCNDSGSTDSSTHQTFVMSYLDDEEGQLELEFDGSSMFITGDDVWYTDSDCNNEGLFVSDEQLSYSVNCSWTNIDRQCWIGEFTDRPTDDMW